MKRKKNGSVNIYKSPFLITGFWLLALYALILLAPMLWAFITSFKDRLDFLDNPFGFPDKWHFSNYATAFRNIYVPVSGQPVHMPILLLNSILYAVGCTLMHTLVPLVTAYAAEKYRYRFSNFVYALVIVALIIPIVGSLPSEIQIMRALGFYDNIIGIWILKGTFLGTNFLILYAAFRSVPWEFAEAAQVDRASQFRIMTQIMFPMVSKAVFAVALLSFIAYWNEYTTAMIYLPSMPTVSYGLYRFQFANTQEINYVPIQVAGCMLMTIPLFVLFMAFHNRLMGNIAIGGLKG
ncbi:MAG: carbohydrate ABC transporter permease [Clostridiales bacterium]|jgi:raffinose/stachyose/melibiose transport system permease protein|nr:carbohydrate ABC transporter permease [Clostridiales bacterium]